SDVVDRPLHRPEPYDRASPARPASKAAAPAAHGRRNGEAREAGDGAECRVDREPDIAAVVGDGRRRRQGNPVRDDPWGRLEGDRLGPAISRAVAEPEQEPGGDDAG